MSTESFFSFFRPANSLLIGSLAGASVLAAGPPTSTFTPFQCGAAWALMAAAAYALNDLIDMEVDQVNKPWRYLPSLGYRPLWASWLIGLLLGLGIVIAFTAGPSFSIIAVSWSIVACGYSFGIKKRLGWAANLIAAAVIAGAASPGFALGVSHYPFLGICPILFLLMTSREIFKDIEDLDGDLLAGRRTLPVLIGPAPAARLAGMAAALGWLALVFLAFGGGWIKVIDFCLALGGISWSLRHVRHPPTAERAHSAQRQLRWLSVALFCCFLLSIGASQ